MSEQNQNQNGAVAKPRNASHRGECQACGRIQKLPRGRLSLHGYHKQWGFFSGICQGANHLPLEESKDLIESCIALAECERDSAMANAAAIRASRDGKAWVDIARFGGRYFKLCAIVGEPFNFSAVVDESGKQVRLLNYAGEYPKSVQEACNYYNERYARSIDRRVASLGYYIKWQQQRIADWKPRPLQPIF